MRHVLVREREESEGFPRVYLRGASGVYLREWFVALLVAAGRMVE